MKSIKFYTDGSFTTKKPTISGWGYISEDRQIKNSGALTGDIVSMRQIGGELKAAMEAIKYAIDNKYEEVVICYDYTGIEKWASGVWGTNKKWTKIYKEWVIARKKQINIVFQKISGDFNIADEAARTYTGAKCAH